MVYTNSTGGGRTNGNGAYPTVALPVMSSSPYTSASSSSPYSTAGLNGGGALGGSSSSAKNGRLTAPSSNLGLRQRDAVAICVCLFLLRLAFTPSNTAITGSGGLINFSDSSIRASMELAFYSPFKSIPPGPKKRHSEGRFDNNEGKRTARPVPLDVDGDGISEAVVLPVFLNRNEIKQEKELELEESKKNSRGSFAKLRLSKEGIDGSALEGWDEDGSWGLRILNLKPLHHRREVDEREGGGSVAVAGPFSPRSLFLSALFPYAWDNAGEHHDHTKGTPKSTFEVYPIKLISIQIPIQRTHLGEEEKSRQRHAKQNSGSSGSYGKNDAIPPKDDQMSSQYDRTRHYFCGKDWHHADDSCHKHCGGGLSSECSEGETCYADTSCDAHIETSSNDSKDDATGGDEPTWALTNHGTLPGISTVWSDGSVSLHVITADIVTTTPEVGSDGHRPKRSKQKNKKPELELRQLWRVYPFERGSGEVGNTVDFEEMGLAFESGAMYGSTPEKNGDNNNNEGKRYGDNGAILLGGRYTLTSSNGVQPLKVSYHALDSMTGTSLWDLKGNHEDKDKPKPTESAVPIIHTTSSARRRSHLPTTDVFDDDLDNENAFIDGDDVMTSEECMSHFRASVLDGESGALPHEFWDNGEFGSISVGRFDRGKKLGGKRPRKKAFGKGKNLLSKGAAGGPGGGKAVRAADGVIMAGAGMGPGRQTAPGTKGGDGGRGRGSAGSWQSDIFQRAVPRRLIKQQKYNARHPHMGKPNVVLFHGHEGLSVLSLKNGRPVCHISLMDHALYADMDQDGVIDIVQVVTSPKGFSKSSAVQGLINRIAKEASRYTQMPTGQVICHALVTSGLPPREEVFTAPLCLGGPTTSRSKSASAAPPLLVEGSLGYGNDVVFAMNNGVVVRYDFNGRQVWRKKGGLKDGTPSWDSQTSSAAAFLGRIQFGAVKESHSSVSASSHRNQHRPGSPVRPILLSGEDGAALISPASGKVLSSVVYPQSVTSQPILADLSGDGTDDLLVVSNDAIWGYRVVVETGRSGGFTIVVVTLLIGVALAALAHKTSSSHIPGQTPKRSTDA